MRLMANKKHVTRDLFLIGYKQHPAASMLLTWRDQHVHHCMLLIRHNRHSREAVFLMSKGIGRMQRWILMRALKNRQSDSRHPDSKHPNIYRAEVAPGYDLPLCQAHCRQDVADGCAVGVQPEAAADEQIDGDAAADKVRDFFASPGRVYGSRATDTSHLFCRFHWLISNAQPQVSHALRSLLDRNLLALDRRSSASCAAYNLTDSGVALAEKLTAKPREIILNGYPLGEQVEAIAE
jgi:hypothetical protein